MIKEDGGEKRARGWLRVSVVLEPTSGVKRFRKFFCIPDGVVSDEIKTIFIEEESVLRIFMPKSVKGVSGVGVEEVKEEEIGSGWHKRAVPKTENPRNKEQQELEIPAKEDADLQAKFEEYIAHEQIKSEQERDRTESLKPDDHPHEVQVMVGNEVPADINGVEHDRTESLKPKEVQIMGGGNEVPADINGVEPSKEKHDGGKGSSVPSRKYSLIRPCLFAGFAILLSVVLVIRF